MPSAPERDYYEVLGVPRNADPKQIKDAYHRLAMRYHPDRNKASDAEERFKEIAKAYAVLHDPEKRAEYDARGHAGVAHFSHEDLYGDLDFGDRFDGLDLTGGLFGRVFGARRRGPPRGADVHVELVIPLESVLSGGEEIVRYHRSGGCAACRGTGAKSGTQPRRCAPCDGNGRKVVTRWDNGVTFQQISTCPVCHGRGEFIDELCPECGGRGKVEREEAVQITIPPGVEEGMVLRVPQHGMPSEASDGKPGDLLIIVRSRPDPKFERRGADLWHVLTISIPDAVLGTRLEVPTLKGSAMLSIPAGTQPYTVFGLRGKGLPVFGGGGHGSLNVRIAYEIPKKLTRRQRELYEQLREDNKESESTKERLFDRLRGRIRRAASRSGF